VQLVRRRTGRALPVVAVEDTEIDQLYPQHTQYVQLYEVLHVLARAAASRHANLIERERELHR